MTTNVTEILRTENLCFRRPAWFRSGLWLPGSRSIKYRPQSVFLFFDVFWLVEKRKGYRYWAFLLSFQLIRTRQNTIAVRNLLNIVPRNCDPFGMQGTRDSGETDFLNLDFRLPVLVLRMPWALRRLWQQQFLQIEHLFGLSPVFFIVSLKPINRPQKIPLPQSLVSRCWPRRT